MDTSHPKGPAPVFHNSRGKPNSDVRRPRPYRGRGGKSRGKPSDRTTQWRDRQNQRVVAEMDAARNARLNSFMPDPQDSLQSQQPATPQPSSTPEYQSVQFLGMAVTPYAHPLPISTQALGFMTNQFYLKLQHHLGAEKVTERCTVHQFYRYSLAQLTYHLYRLHAEQASRYSFRTELPIPIPITSSFREAMKTLELNVGFITSYIQRIGVVIAHDVPHVPIMMDDRSPFYLNLFNLRNTLVAANQDDDRYNHFMAHNPVPGVKTRGDRITNIDEIIPALYTAQSLYHDASAVRALMNFTASKMRDMTIYTGRLGQISEGNACILLASSALAEGLDPSIPSMTGNGLIASVQGTIDSYWGSVKLTDEQAKLGVLGLYMREDTGGAHLPTGNSWLSSETAHYVYSADYAAYLNRLIG